MKKGFCYQENTRYSQAVACSRETFWKEVRKAANRWAIDSRRAILAAVEKKDEAAIQKWMSSADFRKFLEKKHRLKRESARKKFFEKSQEDQLLAFAQELKDNLTAFIFSCYEFDATATAKAGTTFRRRKLADCHLNGLVMLDIDHVENPVAIWERLQQHEELMQRTKLVHITSSERGIRIIFTADVKVGNLADNQIAFAEALGYQADSSCIDATRNSFAPKEEDILFIEDSIFEYYDEAFDKKYTKEYRKGNTKPTRRLSPRPPYKGGSGHTVGRAQGGRTSQPAAINADAQSNDSAPSLIGRAGGESWRGHSVQAIIDARFAEKLPCAEDSNRHNESLKLASDLLVLFDGDKQKTLQVLQAQPWVQEIIDERDEDVEQTVESAAERMAEREKKYLTQSPSKPMQAAIKQATGQTYAEITAGNASLPLRGDLEGSEAGVESDADVPPAMPAKLPQLIGLLTSKTPEEYKAAVAHAVFPALATHLCDVRFNYTDNVEHEATLMNCLMAVTGAGKGCIDEPIRHIMADIELRDEENTRREAEWKRDCQRKGANKDKQLRPQGLVIQIIDPDMTKPALVTRMEEAEGHFVYVKLNELDLFDQLKGTTGKQHFQLMCLAFDPGATYGQTRVGTQSVTARPRCRFNWNACTTILKGRRFFRNVLTDGPISRINFCTIPETEIGCEQPVYGKYDMEFDEALKPYIDNLTKARGLIDCPQAFELARKLQQECAEFARLSQSETYWNLSHRACVIAWLKACVLYVAAGQQWEPEIEDFVRWSLEYDLWCKMQFFGADIEKANEDSERTGKRGPRNLLELLPDKFTLDDAKRVRKQQGISNEGYRAIRMIRTWVNRGYVIQNTEYSFQKST